ncbi:MAG: TIGR01777 family protein [Alphaproteobacteria bacterium]|nr:TIGR01777 family protein [Alphaproteobacteria bacterium]
MPCSVEELFDWHARPGAFERLNPPWDPVRVLSRSGEGLDAGQRLELEARFGPVPVRWVTVHTACERPGGFVDEQESGPFASWRHEHRFLAEGEGSVLEDHIRWEAPLGAVGGAVTAVTVAPRLERAFAFRHRRTHDDLVRHRGVRPRRVAITGATGMVGTELSAFLTTGGHEVLPVSRRTGIRWDIDRGELEAEALEGVDAVVHLAGESVASEPWSAERKRAITESRIRSTDLLCRTLAKLERKPAVLISASAVGFYGDRGEEELTEDSGSGTGFLAEVGRAWEGATAPAEDAGIRVVHLRVGIVQSCKGGALATMLPLFRAGGGGPIGDGAQWVPWIHLDDLVGAIHFLFDADLSGPVNSVGPAPVRQGEHAHTLGRVLSRPALVPAPRFAVSVAMGPERARELVFASQRALPRRLLDAGFRFLHPDLDGALRFELGQVTEAG